MKLVLFLPPELGSRASPVPYPRQLTGRHPPHLRGHWGATRAGHVLVRGKTRARRLSAAPNGRESAGATALSGSGSCRGERGLTPPETPGVCLGSAGTALGGLGKVDPAVGGSGEALAEAEGNSEGSYFPSSAVSHDEERLAAGCTQEDDQAPSNKSGVCANEHAASSTVGASGALVAASAVETEAMAAGQHVQPTGLRRSPSSGGVPSATQAHGLPDPHVAVRNLIAQSRDGHLCTVMSRMHHRRAGYPFASLIDFATDAGGHPIFSLSPLSIHARNLLAYPRCTLVVQIPGWSGLADARVTLFGEVYPVPADRQDLANRIFCSRHKQEHSSSWGNSHFFRMETIEDIYFVGGFGTVSWVDTGLYNSVQPDKIAREDSEQTLEILNAELGAKLRESLDSLVQGGAPAVERVQFIAVDGKGVDIRVQQGSQAHVRRISFASPAPVENVDQALAALQDLLLRSALPSDLVEQQQ